MREIKFRAWDKIEQKMWAPIIDRDGIPCARDPITGQLVRMSGELLDPVMQYIGLKDKNGKEIYEGDIVKAHYFYFNGNFGNDGEIKGKVEYSPWCTFIINDLVDGEEHYLEFHETSHFEEPCIEVIGNIYENPELLSANPRNCI